MKKKNTKLFTAEFVEIILIPIIAVLSSYIVSVVQEPLSFWQVLSTFLAVLILVSIMHIIALRTTSRRIENILHDRAEEICRAAYQKAKQEIDSTLCDIGVSAITKYEEKRKENELLGERFFPIQKLEEIERSGFWDGKRIVSVKCLTSTLKYLENDEHNFGNIVALNVKKGIKYTYFYEDNAFNSDIFSAMKAKFGDSVQYVKIPHEQFWILVDDFDFTIYEVETHDGNRENICIMSTATLIEGSPYHVIASPALTMRITNVLSSLTEKLVANN